MTRIRAVPMLAGGAALGLVVCAPPARADSPVVSRDAAVVSPDEMSRRVDVRDVRVNGDEVSGTVVNNSGKTVENVRLVVNYIWLWNNEFKPGTDSPERAVYMTVPGQLAPGETRDFSYWPESPLPRRRDGRFAPAVEVAEVTEITSPGSLGSAR